MLMKHLVAKTFEVSKLTRIILLLVVFGLTSTHAENVFITGWKGTTANSTDYTPDPLSVIDSGFPGSGAGNASASVVSPVPIIPNNARRIHYGRSAGATWLLTPTNMTVTPVTPAGTGPYTFTALQNIGVYKIYLTKGQNNNASTNIIIEMTATGGALADTNGVGATAIYLDMYQKGKPNGVWVHVGYITNSIFSPTISLKHFSGEINDTDAANGNAQRWYTDAIRFEYLDACAGVAEEVNVVGPLVAGQTFVTLTNVALGATNVTVYVNNSQVAQLTNSPGFLTNVLNVTTPPLVKGQRITAGQTKGGCSSLVPTTGPMVGGGPNSQIKAFLSCWQNSAFQGPVGASTTSNLTANYFLKADGLTSAFGTAPTGGQPLPTGDCWQTVTFNHATDPAIYSTGGGITTGDPYCALAGLLFTIDSDNSGPYDIYVDEIKNGNTVIENFEGYSIGSTNAFSAPKTATAPNPGSTYLAEPNSSVISQNNVFEGTNALRIQWQWSDNSNVRWAHILATNSNKCYPQLDTSKPITVRYLVLQSNQTTNRLSFTTVPQSQLKSVGDTLTLSVQAKGEGPFTYQWQYAGTPLTDETNSVYTKLNLQESDTGDYSVVVTGANGTGCSATVSALVTVTTAILPPTLSYSVGGGQITLTWTGSFTLQSNTNLTTGSWNDVTATSGYSESLTTDSTKFFRLRQ